MAEAETKEYFSTSLCLYYLTIEKTLFSCHILLAGGRAVLLLLCHGAVLELNILIG